ncbi:recombinase family protein [Herbihabitans rhizosphaerae]|uniref:recombinase family protein n=1 Tax=Herbihabitans rhizosphaerae TaxID=1872711 RepID=UPI0013EEE338|nr:recombinase family protein [Herbihabitans rhizosphaerae]
MFDSYGRLSWNPNTHELEKIETQWADNRVTIGRHGGVVGLELSDGLSAWKKGVRRKDFEKLLERAEQGLSNGIAVWHVDRLFRQPRDLERLIDLADKGFRVISSHGSRDLSDPDDRYILRIEVAQAAKASDDMSRRVKRRFAAYREKGRTTGGRPGFGFPRMDPDWVPGPGESEEDRPMLPARQIARERTALRRAVNAMVITAADKDTAPQMEIVRAWNAQGLRTVNGKEWVNNTVRATLLRPALAGRIEYDGVLVGRLPGKPIVDEKTWLRLRAMYEGRRRGAQVSRRYLASGLIRCGVCKRKLSGRMKDPGNGGEPVAVYWCNRQQRGCGKLYANARRVDNELRLMVIARLSDSRYAQALTAARARVSERLTELNTEIGEIEKLQDAYSDRLARREVTLDRFDAANRQLNDDLAPLLAERKELTGTSGGGADGEVRAMSAEQVAHDWKKAGIDQRRSMIADATGTDEIWIMPGRRGVGWKRERVQLIDPKNPPT